MGGQLSLRLVVALPVRFVFRTTLAIRYAAAAELDDLLNALRAGDRARVKRQIDGGASVDATDETQSRSGMEHTSTPIKNIRVQGILRIAALTVALLAKPMGGADDLPKCNSTTIESAPDSWQMDF